MRRRDRGLAAAAAPPSTRPQPPFAVALTLLLDVGMLGSRGARAFPVYYSADGTAMVRSANGANVVLAPDGNGACAQPPARQGRQP